jgi:flagellar hook-length control protein FliK
MVSSAISGTGSVSAQDGKVSQTSKSKESGLDFSKVLSKSVTGNLSESNKNTSAKMSTNVAAAQKNDTSAKTTAKDTSTDKTTQKDNTSKVTDSKDTKQTDNTNQSADTKQTVTDKATDAGKEVAEEIKEKFDVTDEQLTQAMEALGLTFADLLVPNNITQLVVQVTDSQNVMDIVTDESLSNALMDVVDFANAQLSNIADEVNLPVEAVNDIIKNVENGAAPVVQEEDGVTNEPKAVEALPEETVSAETADKSDVSMSDVIASKLTVNNDESESQTGAKNEGNALTENSKADGENITAQTGNVVNSIQEAFETAFESAGSEVDAVDVVNQVVESIKLNNTTELKSMEIQLNPQNLGKVNLMVSVREGVVTAQITAENEQVRKALESQITTLKENIQNQGIKVDAVEVTVQSHSFEANQQFAGGQQAAEQGRRSSRRINLGGFGVDDEETEEDDTVINYNENSSVEFTA